ncbi:hypothetical protein D3C81_1410300 [compost metagenome]
MFSIAATSWRWAGMMMRNTLPTMMVPMIAPVCRYAPRPLNTRLKPQHAAMISTNSTAPSSAGFLPRGESHRKS